MWLSPGGSLLKSLETVLEKVDSTAASTLGKAEKQQNEVSALREGKNILL